MRQRHEILHVLSPADWGSKTALLLRTLTGYMSRPQFFVAFHSAPPFLQICRLHIHMQTMNVKCYLKSLMRKCNEYILYQQY